MQLHGKSSKISYIQSQLLMKHFSSNTRLFVACWFGCSFYLGNMQCILALTLRSLTVPQDVAGTATFFIPGVCVWPPVPKSSRKATRLKAWCWKEGSELKFKRGQNCDYKLNKIGECKREVYLNPRGLKISIKCSS